MNIIMATLVQNIVRSILAFVLTFHIGVYVFYMPYRAINIINIGALYCETIHRSETMKDDVDYRHVRVQLVIVLIDVVIPIEYAIRLGIDRKKAVTALTGQSTDRSSSTRDSNITDDADDDDGIKLSSICIDDFKSIDANSTTGTAAAVTVAADRVSVSADSQQVHDSVDGGCSIDYSDVGGSSSAGYGDIYACNDVSSIAEYDTDERATAAYSKLWMNPLHMPYSSDTNSDDHSVIANTSSDGSSADAIDALYYCIQSMEGKPKINLLSLYTRNALQKTKVVKAYQVPDRIRGKRVSFVTAYAHADTFAQNRNKASVTSTIGDAASVIEGTIG